MERDPHASSRGSYIDEERRGHAHLDVEPLRFESQSEQGKNPFRMNQAYNYAPSTTTTSTRNYEYTN